MSDIEAFVCPFCGGPYRTLIPVGVVQVKCKYCKSTILVPPRLGGVVQRCPNHPEVLAVGLCNDCGKGYCDRCLYVHKVRGGKLHVCSKCYDNRQTKNVIGGILGFTLMLFVVVLFFARSPPFGVFAFGVFIVCIFIVLYELGKKPFTVHDSRQTQNN